MSRQLVVLGSGTSFGVPVIGCRCAVCTSSDPRDRRTRVAAVIEDGATRLLIDTPPELRLQLIREGIAEVDAVLYTHEHADHVHGIDDLRAVTARRGALPLYGPPDTIAGLAHRFRYIFDDAVPATPGSSKPELLPVALEAGREIDIAGVRVLPVELDHGAGPVYGYRIGPLAYLTDVKRVPDGAHRLLAGVETLVINALFDRPHPAHLSIDEAVEVGRRVGAARTILTHLTHRFAHADLAARLPAGAEPAFDGMRVAF